MRAALVVLALLLTGCGGPEEVDGRQQRTLTVLAAASLTKAFTAEARAFERAHPGLTVALSFGGSPSLVAQVQQGAPSSVIATADLTTLAALSDELNGRPVVFAHNQLALVTPSDNPAGVGGLGDLARPGVKVVLAAPGVPAGRAAAAALAEAGVTVRPVSLEDAVTGVVSKVRLGEADAGIAYVTDLVGATDLKGIPLPGTRTDLAIAALRDLPAPEDAEAFIAFVRSEQGQAVLRAYGFT